MRREQTERLRLLLIASCVASGALALIFGMPRVRAWMTPRLERVVVVSAALGDDAATAAPRSVLEGVPVTLYALLEGSSRWSGERTLYGPVTRVRLAADAAPVAVSPWSSWWYQPEFLWFKVEPTHPFANESFAADFEAADIAFTRNYQVNWGFGWSHAVDVHPTGDAYPEWPTGTMRFTARGVIRDWRDRLIDQAEGPEAADVLSAEPDRRPHAVTVRGGDDAFGTMQGFAGLPYVPVIGRRPDDRHPAALLLGGTVLDFWLASLRAVGVYEGDLVAWEQLPEISEVVVNDMFLASDGTYYYADDPLTAVEWGVVEPGDVVAIDDHVGILFEDRGPGGGGNGVLDRDDRVLEAYFEPLRDNPMGEAFVADITVRRVIARRAGDDPRALAARAPR